MTPSSLSFPIRTATFDERPSGSTTPRASLDSFACCVPLPSDPKVSLFSLDVLARRFPQIARWPLTKRILLENMLRHEDGDVVDQQMIERFVADHPSTGAVEIPFYPSRIVMQDYAGTSALVDFAGLRDVVQSLGRSPETVCPATEVDLVVDHSLQLVEHGTPSAAAQNLLLEYKTNRTRYAFLRWAEQAIPGLAIVPPGRGIVHQVNVEALSTGTRIDANNILHFDSVVGTDSHTTMVNGIGVLGWGVGGIEALSVMLGLPVWLPAPKVLGVRLEGALRADVYAADVALALSSFLRREGVVGTFLEFFGSGVGALSVYDRTTIANMTPEFGATASLFPITSETADFYERSHTEDTAVNKLRAYLVAQGMQQNLAPGLAAQNAPGGDVGVGVDSDFGVDFDRILPFDLASVLPSVAGPRRPHDLRTLASLPGAFAEALPTDRKNTRAPLSRDGLQDGAIAIAAITSCTNTANPRSIIAAALVAQKAVALGVRVPSHVKCTFTPGSIAVERYLARLDLMSPLQTLGFYIAGFGCGTCVGNSGNLLPAVQQAIDEEGLVAASVLSGNRNFDSRIHPSIAANFLMSPPLVVAMAIAGTVDIAFDTAALAVDSAGNAVYWRDLLPDPVLLDTLVQRMSDEHALTASRTELFAYDTAWSAIPAASSPTFPWRADDTYFRRPDFLKILMVRSKAPLSFLPMRPLVVLGDDITTDHISPVGRIHADSEAGRFLLSEGVTASAFNTYGARRGNAEVMTRGIFDNPRLQNSLVEQPGPFTRTAKQAMPVTLFEASRQISAAGYPAIVIAGKNYGVGSARDWAAKGQRLLGVRVVIAQSFERIHRTNLVMFGVAPIVMAADALDDFKSHITPASVIRIVITDSQQVCPSVEVHVSDVDPESAWNNAAVPIVPTAPNEPNEPNQPHRPQQAFWYPARLQVETANEFRLLSAGGLLASIDW